MQQTMQLINETVYDTVYISACVYDTRMKNTGILIPFQFHLTSVGLQTETFR